VPLFAGCSGAAPSQHATSTPPALTATGGPTVSDLPTPSSPSQPIGATGSLLASGNGTGTGVVPARTARVGAKLTLRLTCSGPGTVRVTDADGGLIMATGGCRQGVVFSSQWAATAHDRSFVRVQVASATSWAVEVWSGTVPDHSLKA
jgi:hypothetical protein